MNTTSLISTASPNLPRRSVPTALLPIRAATAASASEKGKLQTIAIGQAKLVEKQRPLPKQELLMILTQISIMLRSGVDLADAVRSISLRSQSGATRQSMALVYSALESGQKLSDALQQQQGRFSGVMIASIAAAEASGNLTEVLRRLTDIIKDQMRLANSIRSAISYPIVLMFVTSMVLMAMLFFVLPQFARIYESSRAETPLLTQLLLDFSAMVRASWPVIVTLGAALSAAAYRILKTTSAKRKLDHLLLRMPGLGPINRNLINGRLFRLQGSMLASGVPMVEVLGLTKHAVNNTQIVNLIGEVEGSVLQGEGMAPALRISNYIPDEAADMIGTAEANGQLAAVLQTVGEFYESQGEQKMRDFVKIAEPAIIVGMGLVIGSIVLAVMLPLLDLSRAGSM
jgi:type II secretory pathway component PulF